MTIAEFIEAINNGRAKVLTVERAKGLKGRRIYWMYFGYEGNEDKVNEMTVGDIVSELEYYRSQPMDGYPSRAAYWEASMDAEKLQDARDKLLLLDDTGGNPYIFAHTGRWNCFDVPTFTCSDSDREVYYIECGQD